LDVKNLVLGRNQATPPATTVHQPQAATRALPGGEAVQISPGNGASRGCGWGAGRDMSRWKGQRGPTGLTSIICREICWPRTVLGRARKPFHSQTPRLAAHMKSAMRTFGAFDGPMTQCGVCICVQGRPVISLLHAPASVDVGTASFRAAANQYGNMDYRC
jgi:hypothetical protein